MKAVLYFDGSSLGNPGRAGGSAVLKTDDRHIELSKPIGHGTSNQAEYAGLICGLKWAVDNGITELEIFGDSQLVVRQVTGRYRVKASHLLCLLEEAHALLHLIPVYTITWIPRGENARADQLAGWTAQTQEVWKQ